MNKRNIAMSEKQRVAYANAVDSVEAYYTLVSFDTRPVKVSIAIENAGTFAVATNANGYAVKVKGRGINGALIALAKFYDAAGAAYIARKRTACQGAA